MKEKGYLYLAYGSNMSAERLFRRCPDARRIGAALLPGYRRVERLYADIDKDKTSQVEGVLYTLTKEDIEKLDRFEGCPFVYQKKVLKAFYNDRMIRVFTYILTKQSKRERDGLPYPEDYLQICMQGAAEHGIKSEFSSMGELW